MDIHINFMKQQVTKSYQLILDELKSSYFNPRESFIYNITEETIKVINRNNNTFHNDYNNNSNKINSIFSPSSTQSLSSSSSSSRIVRRIYVFTNNPELGRYHKLGWILDDDIDNCMLCNVSFQQYNCNSFSIYSSNKHHCRACGNIICASCCSSTGYLKDISSSSSTTSSSLHKVCNLCYYGQDEIELFITNQCNLITISQLNPRMSWVHNNEIEIDHTDNNDNYLKPVLGLWRYGIVRNIQVQLSLLFQARIHHHHQSYSKLKQQQEQQQNISSLSYIYIYSSPFVPYNNNGSKSYQNENIYILINNEVEKNKNNDKIFTVTVHPNVMKEYFKDLHESRIIRNKVCTVFMFVCMFIYIYIYIHIYIYMYICMHGCIYVCMYVCMYMVVSTYVYMHSMYVWLYMYGCIHKCMYGCMHVWLYGCMVVSMYVYLYVGWLCMVVCMYSCTYIYIYISVCMHVYLCVYIYVYIYVCYF